MRFNHSVIDFFLGFSSFVVLSLNLPTQAENDALAGNNGSPSSTNTYVTQTGFQRGQEIYAATATGNDTYVITLSPVPAAYVNGMVFSFKTDVANTGAATLNVNSLGAINIQKGVAGALTALETGDLAANYIAHVIYNSTGPVFELLNPATLISAANATTLTGGTSSNADALHTHSFVKKISNVITPVTATAAAETTLISVTIPGGTLGTTGAIAVQLNLTNVSITNTSTATIRFKYAGSTYITSSINNGSGGDVAGLGGTCTFMLYANGATGTQTGFAYTVAAADHVTGAAATTNVASLSATDSCGSTAGDSTVNQTLAITLEYSGAAAGNTTTMHSASIYALI